jgi:hypothetical protein
MMGALVWTVWRIPSQTEALIHSDYRNISGFSAKKAIDCRQLTRNL